MMMQRVNDDSFPTLFSKTSTGEIYTWRVWVEDNSVYTEHGLMNGKKQVVSYEAEPKNIGKKNETTAYEQAVREALAMWNHRKERKYRTCIEDLNFDPRPMLAKDYHEHGHKYSDNVSWYIQPKYDGCRAIAYRDSTGVVNLYSRSGKTWNLPHIVEALTEYMSVGDVLDGEIYNHSMSFQEITSASKKIQATTKKLEYHIFDAPTIDGKSDLVFKDRFGKMCERYPENDLLIMSPTVITKHIQNAHKQNIKLGYEGSILRHPDGVYRFGYRSDALLKLKDFQDNEYKIIGYETGKGKFKNCPIFVCVTDKNQEFRVTPKGTEQERKTMLEEAPKYIGELLKVQFQELTNDGIPRFPVGLGIRLRKDM